MNEEEKKKIMQSQGVKFRRPDLSRQPKNRIEAALARSESHSAEGDFLPQIKKAPIREENVLDEKEKNNGEGLNLPKKEKKKFKKLVLLSLLLLVAVSYAGYQGRGYLPNSFNIFDLVQDKSVSDYKKTIEEVGKLVALPSGEDPTVATVTSLEPLKGQEFFKDAEVGDKVLIFSKSKKAVLYRPSEKRIIVMAPLNTQ
jgi:hypothetical protein